MLLVPTYLSKSAVHGTGVFASASIAKGTLMWEYVEGLDMVLSEEAIAAMPQIGQDLVFEYGYPSPHFPGGYVLSADNSRFINHNDTPNTDNNSERAYALRDIAAGEEITCDYAQLDESQLALPYVHASKKASA